VINNWALAWSMARGGIAGWSSEYLRPSTEESIALKEFLEEP
jgi:hypothetical protein